MTPLLKPGDHVKLICPDNLRLHGAIGIVKHFTDWGAHVSTLAAATGEFRALWEEMEPAVPELLADTSSTLPEELIDTPVDLTKPKANGTHKSRPKPKPNRPVSSAEYSGDFCPNCYGSRMIRNGSCLLCLECGETTGCS